MEVTLSFWDQIKESYDDLIRRTDPRVKDKLFVGNPVIPSLIIVGYLLFIFLGPRWMKHRKPLQIKPLLVIYNFGMVFFSAYIVREMLLGGWLFYYSLGCQPVDYSNDPKAVRMARATWLFYVAKFVELLDTVFFILRKKNNQVSFLHVFHHGCLPMFWWWGVIIVPGGFGTFHALVNAFVHIVMYFYYGLTTLGPKFQKYLWWKRYVTVLQLTQFFIVTIHNSQFLWMECDYPWIFVAYIQGFTTIVAVLFLNFYIKTYLRKPAKTEQRAVKNIEHMNGYVMNGDAVHTKAHSKHRNGYIVNTGLSNGGLQRRKPESNKL